MPSSQCTFALAGPRLAEPPDEEAVSVATSAEDAVAAVGNSVRGTDKEDARKDGPGVSGQTSDVKSIVVGAAGV